MSEPHLSRIVQELNAVASGLSAHDLEKFIEILGRRLMVAGASIRCRVFISAAGRSGLVARCFGNRLVHLGVETHVVGEVTAPSIGPDDLLLVVSNSGSTGGPLMVARRAVEIGADVVLVSSADSGPIAQVASCTLVIPRVGMSEQPLGSLFEQAALLVLDAVAESLQERYGVSEAAMAARHSNLE